MVMTAHPLNNGEDRWLNTRQAAAYLGYALQTLYNKVGEKDGPPAHRIGRTLKFRRSELDRWVTERAKASAA